MISLSDLQPFAIGGRRECFVHPLDRTRCVKIHRPEFLPSILKKNAPWWRSIRKSERSFDENFSDWSVMQSLEARKDPTVWEHIPRCYGWEETDRGKGLVIELLRDADGLISLSLLHWIWENGSGEKLDRAIAAFTAFWETHTIPSRSLGLHNISMQELADGNSRMVLIDGLGSTNFSTTNPFPFDHWTRYFAICSSCRKVRRMKREINELLKKRETGSSPSKRGVLLSRE